MPTKFKGNHKCEGKPEAKQTDFKKASEVKPKQSSIGDDVASLVTIAKELAGQLGKNVPELTESQSAWVSTIYIQRKRNGLD